MKPFVKIMFDCCRLSMHHLNVFILYKLKKKNVNLCFLFLFSQKAKEMLSKHFLVGITENMNGFIALLSVEFDWPPEILCLPWPCQLKAGGGGYDCATAGTTTSITTYSYFLMHDLFNTPVKLRLKIILIIIIKLQC
jgi:hypothetical protein